MIHFFNVNLSFAMSSSKTEIGFQNLLLLKTGINWYKPDFTRCPITNHNHENVYSDPESVPV